MWRLCPIQERLIINAHECKCSKCALKERQAFVCTWIVVCRLSPWPFLPCGRRLCATCMGVQFRSSPTTCRMCPPSNSWPSRGPWARTAWPSPTPSTTRLATRRTSSGIMRTCGGGVVPRGGAQLAAAGLLADGCRVVGCSLEESLALTSSSVSSIGAVEGLV